MPNRIADQTAALINHTITNSPKKISQLRVIDLILSDHSLIYCTRSTPLPKSHKLNEISDRNWILTHNHLVCKRTRHVWLNGFVCLRAKWLLVRTRLQSLKFQILRLFRATKHEIDSFPKLPDLYLCKKNLLRVYK